jgi:hypothetical protein
VVKITELGRSLERKTGSIRNCIEQGTIPPALVRLAGNVRAWPVAEANAIIAAARSERILSKRVGHIGNQLLPARLGSPHCPADVGRWRSGSQVRYQGELLLIRQKAPSWQQVGRVRANARVQAGTSEAAGALT